MNLNEHNEELLNCLIEASYEASEMIRSLKRQNVDNFFGLFDIRECADLMFFEIKKENKLSESTFRKWESIYGRFYRSLEGTTLLKLLDSIDKLLLK